MAQAEAPIDRSIDLAIQSKDQPTTEERTIGQSIDPEKKSKSKSSDRPPG